MLLRELPPGLVTGDEGGLRGRQDGQRPQDQMGHRHAALPQTEEQCWQGPLPSLSPMVRALVNQSHPQSEHGAQVPQPLTCRRAYPALRISFLPQR